MIYVTVNSLKHGIIDWAIDDKAEDTLIALFDKLGRRGADAGWQRSQINWEEFDRWMRSRMPYHAGKN